MNKITRISFAGGFWLGLAIFYYLICETYKTGIGIDIILFILCILFVIANVMAWNEE